MGCSSTSLEKSFSTAASSETVPRCYQSATVTPSARPSSERPKSGREESASDCEAQLSSSRKRKKESGTRRLFACPFYKLNPLKQRSCHSATLSEIRYVKQHLRRSHMQPLHCSRCKAIFDSWNERDHHRVARGCAHSSACVEGITSNQARQLRSWSAKRGSSQEGQWFALWGIVFPDIPCPPSPFVDAGDFGEFNQPLANFSRQLSTSCHRGTPEILSNLRRVRTSSPSAGMMTDFSQPDQEAQSKTSWNGNFKEEPPLACPFFKKSPQNYCSSKWRSCHAPGWHTVHRVK